MKEPSHLLETVAERILTRIFEELIIVQSATVSVSKVNPPIGGDVAMVTVERTKRRS
jgi:dihydroneopterin aldolase